MVEPRREKKPDEHTRETENLAYEPAHGASRDAYRQDEQNQKIDHERFPISSPQIAAGEDPERLPVLGAGCFDDVARQFRSRRLLIPADTLQIVTNKLFVEGGLRFSRRVLVRRPEA